jgi:hypothetical protein
MSMELISYLFFAALFIASYIVGKWLEDSDKARGN